jgi:hypothetical protein
LAPTLRVVLVVLGVLELRVGCESCGPATPYVLDAGVDSGLPDAGETDAGTPDSGATDSGLADSGAPDSGVLDSGVIDAGPWVAVSGDLLASLDAGTTAAATFTLLAAPSGNWCGGVLAPNGLIFSVPQGIGTDVLVIDTSNDTVSSFAHGQPMYGGDWCGGVLAPNGLIYFIPWSRAAPDAGYFIQLDPVTRAVKPVGNAVGTCCGNGTYGAGTLANNGAVYVVPGTEAFVLKFDPSTYATTNIGPDLGATSSGKWLGAQLAPNGKIYVPPVDNTETRLLIVDPATDGVTTVDLSAMANRGWLGGAIGWNGKVYFCPWTSDSVLELDPADDSVKVFPVSGVTPNSIAFNNLATGSDGKLYSAAYMNVFGNKILVVDPSDGGVVVTDTGLPHTNANWDGITAGPNGKIYGIPDYASPGVMVIDVHAVRAVSPATMRTGFFNKY